MLVLLLNSGKRTLNNMKWKRGPSSLRERGEKMDASTHTLLHTVCQASTGYTHTHTHDFKVPLNTIFSAYFPNKRLMHSRKSSPMLIMKSGKIQFNGSLFLN